MGHYKQQQDGRPLKPLRAHKPKSTGCAFPGCPEPHWGNGLCRPHNKERKEGASSAVPKEAPYKVQQRSGGRWFTVGFGVDRKSAHRALDAYRQSHPENAYRLILGKGYRAA